MTRQQKIKRIYSVAGILVLLLFVFSIVPMALAGSGKNERSGKGNNVPSDTQSKTKLESAQESVQTEDSGSSADSDEKTEQDKRRARTVKKTIKQSKTSTQNPTRESGDVSHSDAGDSSESSPRLVQSRLEARKEAARQKLEQARETMKKAKEEYDRVKSKYEDVKKEHKKTSSELADLNKKAKSCTHEDDCSIKKGALKKGVQQHLLKTIDLIDRSLEKLTNRVEKSNVLSAENKEQALARILELETTLIAEKEDVLALSGNSTNQEVRQAVKDLKKTWQDVRKEQKRIVSLLISKKQENLAEKHDDYAVRLQEKIDELAVQGADTVELNAIYGQFLAATEQLKADTAAAKEAWTRARTGTGTMAEWEAAQLKVREDLAATKELLKQFMQLYEQLKAGTMESSAEGSDSGSQSSGTDVGTTTSPDEGSDDAQSPGSGDGSSEETPAGTVPDGSDDSTGETSSGRTEEEAALVEAVEIPATDSGDGAGLAPSESTAVS